LNTILGGSFTSRLNQNLREEHGYTYGAGSTFDFRPHPGPFVASASVQTEVTDKALQEFMKELRGILGDIPEAELERAKNYVALSYPSGFQTISQIAGELAELVQYNLPDSYFNEYIQNILKVSKAEVEAAAKQYLDPERVAVVVVGDREKIEAGIKQLNLGTLEPVAIAEVLGPVPELSPPQ
jgi:zinc protease